MIIRAGQQIDGDAAGHGAIDRLRLQKLIVFVPCNAYRRVALINIANEQRSRAFFSDDRLRKVMSVNYGRHCTLSVTW